MKRNSILSISKLSSVLFSTGVGLFSLSASTYAQTSVRTPMEVLRQTEGAARAGEVDLEKSNDQLYLTLPSSVTPIHVRTPNDFVARTPMALMAGANWQTPNHISDQVDVETPTAVDAINEKHDSSDFVIRLPANLTPYDKFSPPKIVSAASAKIASMSQFGATAVQQEINFSDSTLVDSPTINKQPYQHASAMPSLADEKFADHDGHVSRLVTTSKTPRPAPPFSVFIDGPDALKVNQVADYEIAVANSYSKTTPASSICLEIPIRAEILLAEQKAEVNVFERTLTWKIPALAPGGQKQIRLRLKFVGPCDANFPITVVQNGLESKTISETTFVR